MGKFVGEKVGDAVGVLVWSGKRVKSSVGVEEGVLVGVPEGNGVNGVDVAVGVAVSVGAVLVGVGEEVFVGDGVAVSVGTVAVGEGVCVEVYVGVVVSVGGVPVGVEEGISVGVAMTAGW